MMPFNLFKKPTLDELRDMREVQAEKFKKYSVKVHDNIKKDTVKKDIRRIKSANLRAKYGITSEKIDKLDNAMKGMREKVMKLGKGTVKVLGALSESSNDYHKATQKKNKMRY